VELFSNSSILSEVEGQVDLLLSVAYGSISPSDLIIKPLHHIDIERALQLK